MASLTKALVIFIFLSASFFTSHGFARILINESAPPGDQAVNDQSEAVNDSTGTNTALNTTSASYSDDMSSLKSKNKMGVATTVGGEMGLIGLSLEINFTSATTFSIGSGISTGFGAFNMNIKTDLTSGAFQAYAVGGYSRWFSNSARTNLKNTSPSFLYSKFLSPDERATGKFVKNIIYPGLGLQYTNLNGQYAGLGFFGEVLTMMELSNLAVVPTAGLGAVYYF